ncbi:hypothetical protein POV27_19580 [Aureisphaera galaxeae]|uniref:hypothetical protein n=1 Tax=Aureisphaera galaxeae TaxID=1538023 RepID=UPI00234FF8B5|nr:hypothetical protein [Aureisphaera galaxeae]MDC8006264.1 hypothetical protein [Aureisphaera galaxeae]
MDKLSKKEEEILQKWMDEVALESPSASFTDRIMEVVEQKKVVKPLYKPLIGKKGWLLVAAIFVSCMGLLYFFPIAETPYLDALAEKSAQLKNPFEGLEISRTALYSIGMLALFLIQLPFLKSYINRQYSE